jgi:hypothetical protein
MINSGLTSLTISFLKSGKIDRKSLENAGIVSASAGLTYSIAHGWIKENAGLAGEYEWAKVTAAHMLTQGAISDLRGDKSIHGAIAGLAAEATGGDFAQGAMTGAIIHLYNDMAKGLWTMTENQDGHLQTRKGFTTEFRLGSNINTEAPSCGGYVITCTIIGIVATDGVPNETSVETFEKVQFAAKGVDLLNQGVDLINGNEISDLSKSLGFYRSMINKVSNVFRAPDFVKYYEAECDDTLRYYD